MAQGFSALDEKLFGEAKKGKKTKAPPSLDQLLSTAKCGPASWTRGMGNNAHCKMQEEQAC